ncbi:MAG: hypothetical protein HY689_10420 [Chloroflexi bacterium]|nr:hypothetical protein [Chloroflexota bacterium]
MISTVTTSTVSTITAVPGVSASLALVAVVLLLVLLIQKEMVSTNRDGWPRQLSRGLNAGIVPLFMAFALILGQRIVEAFR